MGTLIELIGVLFIVACLGFVCFMLGTIHPALGVCAGLFFTYGIYEILNSTGNI